jgi:hypothetical protein
MGIRETAYILGGMMGHEAIRSLTTEPGARWVRNSWPKNTFVTAIELPLPRSRAYSITVFTNDCRAPWEPTQDDLWATDWRRLSNAVG